MEHEKPTSEVCSRGSESTEEGSPYQPGEWGLRETSPEEVTFDLNLQGEDKQLRTVNAAIVLAEEESTNAQRL